jgi:hypothetical protein
VRFFLTLHSEISLTDNNPLSKQDQRSATSTVDASGLMMSVGHATLRVARDFPKRMLLN